MSVYIADRVDKIYDVLTEIRDALKQTAPISKPDQVIAKADQPIPPPVRLVELEAISVDNLRMGGFPFAADAINRQRAHLQARNERGEDV